MNFTDIEDAFHFVSSAPKLEHTAVISRETGDIYYISEFGDSDEPPDDMETNPDKYIFIPHKIDLSLGKNLVLEFAVTYMKDDLDKIKAICKKNGVFGNFKKLLQKDGLLDEWRKFEIDMCREALKRWCKKQDIVLTD